MAEIGIGLQLYTLRDNMKADMEGTLRKVAELGYEAVEFAGYYDMPADKLRALLDELDLKAIGSHVGLQAIRSDLAGQIEYIKTIGGQYFVCPSVPAAERSDAEGWKSLIAEFEQAGTEVAKHGLQFGYHNHAFEFEVQVEGGYAYDAIYSLTSPGAVQVEMDVCWIQYANQDPLAYIRRYAGRLPLLHLKDFSRENGSMQTKELGQGEVALQDVISAGKDAGVKWFIVEQDNCQNPPLESIANSRAWLRKHFR